MRVIPVVDVMGGVVVRAVGGRRDEYRPVVSKLTDSVEPVAVARAMLEAADADELYVADLDMIRGGDADELYVADLDMIRGGDAVSPAVVELTKAVRVKTWLDVGVRANRDLDLLPAGEHVCPVIASETVWSLGAIGTESIWATGGLAFSIDLFDGVIRGHWKKWGLESPRDVVGLAQRATEYVDVTLIVLDVAGVGTGDGPRTLDAVRAIRAACPRVELISGGGVRDRDDVKRFEDAGANAVLVASALHDGTL